MAIIKLKRPLKLGTGDNVYPMTSADQVVKANGEKLETNGKVNADLLNGKNENQLNVASSDRFSWVSNKDLLSCCVIPFQHSKTGTIHNLTGDYYDNNMIRFASMETWNQGDSLKINGKEARCYDLKKGIRCEDKVLFAKWVLVTASIGYVQEEDIYNVFFNIGEAGPSLEVVGGTTQPTSPKNNTIWINTSAPITFYEIGGTKNPNWNSSEGWTYIFGIMSDYSGMNIFNNQENCAFYFQPICAYQYINGQWQEKKIRWYGQTINTGTTQWNDTAFLYYKGNEANFLTSGWIAQKDSGNPATLTKTSNYLEIQNSNSYSAGWYSTQKIDLTNIKTITVTGQAYYSSNQYNTVELAVGISDSPTLSWGNYKKYSVANGGSANTVYQLTTTLDVSGYTGFYYVNLKMYSAVNGQIYTVTYT